MNRVKVLKKGKNKGKFILYIMERSMRVQYNFALNYAIQQSNELNIPLVVIYPFDAKFATERNFAFFLEGLRDVENEMESLGISFYILEATATQIAKRFEEEARVIILDKTYLNEDKKSIKNLVNNVDNNIIEIESNLVVPVEVASDKEEYAAYTIRKKIERQVDEYLVEMKIEKLESNERIDIEDSLDISDWEVLCKKYNIDRSVGRSNFYQGGYKKAKELLKDFVENKLDDYGKLRNRPDLDYLSHMSPYLRFGHISPIEVALAIRNSGKDIESVASYMEELIVRRELAYNFCYYNVNYDNHKGLKANWIYETLDKHNDDNREYIYTLQEWEAEETHDEVWNACQKELRVSGLMHGYMRMYWGKKILEWSKTYEEAYNIALELNNRYALDGYDANSYTGIAWCFGKHDRPWFERAVFGKVRYMNKGGLKRKFKVEEYIKKVEELERRN